MPAICDKLHQQNNIMMIARVCYFSVEKEYKKDLDVKYHQRTNNRDNLCEIRCNGFSEMSENTSYTCQEMHIHMFTYIQYISWIIKPHLGAGGDQCNSCRCWIHQELAWRYQRSEQGIISQACLILRTLLRSRFDLHTRGRRNVRCADMKKRKPDSNPNVPQRW